MRDAAQISFLADGRRLHLHDGPIDLIIRADGTAHMVDRAYRAATARFVGILEELCAELSLLRAQLSTSSPRPRGSIARRMCEVVAPFCEECFVTPMAAVAGGVAEEVLSVMIHAAQLDRAYVNNGGDIALHLSSSQSYTIGMVERPEAPSLFGAIELSAESGIRGVATSGWRGRSFSLGIADAVTVLAATAAAADAAATIIANAVDLPGHPAITRLPAREIAPDSDLGDLLVTREVGALSAAEIEQALSRGFREAERLRGRRLIRSAALSLQGRSCVTKDHPELDLRHQATGARNLRPSGNSFKGATAKEHSHA
jgi:uncharacterized protein